MSAFSLNHWIIAIVIVGVPIAYAIWHANAAAERRRREEEKRRPPE